MVITSSLQLRHFQLLKCCVFIVTMSWCKAVGTKPKHIRNDVCFKIGSGFTLVLSVLLNKLIVIQQLTKNKFSCALCLQQCIFLFLLNWILRAWAVNLLNLFVNVSSHV
jgi:hypothetical protein